MGFWDILLPGGGSKRAASSGSRGSDCGNGDPGWAARNPDVNRIRVGDEVYHFDGVPSNRRPLSWKVTKVYSPSEAARKWPTCLPTWPSPDYHAPYRYPVLELDGGRRIQSAACHVLEPTINKIYGR
jgi:hypothetical protein